ncbi:MAG: hypothetical protein LBD04_03300 [Synergistaceae bacterium]|jgi:hypothetical protein|nr:hypothetical protein [Synergistaceae bacterium]
MNKMKKFITSVQARVFIAGFCSALCLAALVWVVQPQAASGDEDAVIQRLKAIEDEMKGLRQDLRPLLEFIGVLRNDYYEHERSRASALNAAEASNIVSELRNLKAASMMFYSDSMDVIDSGNADSAINAAGSAKTLLGKYMDNPERLSDLYLFRTTTYSDLGRKWFVGYNLSQVTADVKEKLAGKAKSAGLYSGTAANTPPAGLGAEDVFTTAGPSVWMVAR